MERLKTPMLIYLYEIMDQHTIPLEDMAAQVITAGWLLMMLSDTETAYRRHGTL